MTVWRDRSEQPGQSDKHVKTRLTCLAAALLPFGCLLHPGVDARHAVVGKTLKSKLPISTRGTVEAGNGH